MPQKRSLTILVAPLDWGLGHSTRCIPIIKHLVNCNCTVIIAAEGVSLTLLSTEFPNLKYLPLAGYRIQYTKYKRFLPIKILCQLPKLLLRLNAEHRWLMQAVQQHSIDAVISDNRFGLWHPFLPSIFITHQLLIKGHYKWLERLMQKENYRHINRFSACWVPDIEKEPGLAGTLSHPQKKPSIPLAYLGPLSRLSPVIQPSVKKYDLLILLSGPEPQRTLLERKLLKELEEFKEQVLFIRGLPGHQQTLHAPGNVICKNHLNANELQQALADSSVVISRAGYTTVMDLVILKKPCILIPTPGQTEQEYLATHLEAHHVCIVYPQHSFVLATALQKASSFNYSFPPTQTGQYKQVVEDFIRDLEMRSSR